MSDEIFAQAEKWFLQNDIEVNEKDHNGRKGLYIIVGDNFALELSDEEVDYRAELYRENEDEL